jgi:hypothetical protein
MEGAMMCARQELHHLSVILGTFRICMLEIATISIHKKKGDTVNLTMTFEQCQKERISVAEGMAHVRSKRCHVVPLNYMVALPGCHINAAQGVFAMLRE